ncbi:MAG: DUF1611 domain-containing protein [Deltaproteobacteria bacterium]|nr:DUF1611 domain-containing protein [Deltaproteobacteria bacterium]
MSTSVEGNAVVYCEGAFDTPNGKTGHGLVRRSDRYRILCIVDSHHAGDDAGRILDDTPNGVPVYAGVSEAVAFFKTSPYPATHLVIGLAPDGGRLSVQARTDVIRAIENGLNVDSGLHDFLSEDPEIVALAKSRRVTIRDVRKPPDRHDLHFFTGKIEAVTSLKVAVLGTDSAIGKRTSAWILVDAFRSAGYSADLVGTGQTAWMQGATHGIILDSLINDFVSGEIEHAVWTAWKEAQPDVIIIEGQGSLMNPAYPGGFEILAAGRPDAIILQHAPARKEYDGFPGYPIHPLEKQIMAVELLSGKKVVAVTINHENLSKRDIPGVCDRIEKATGLPAVDVLLHGAQQLVNILDPMLPNGRRT